MQQKLLMKLIKYLFLFFIVTTCKDEPKEKLQNTSKTNALELKYATGFSVTYYDNYKVINLLKPWPKAEKTYSYAIANIDVNIDFKADAFDAIIDSKMSKIVVTSTTHIPALELLGVEETLVGFPGTDYISSKKTRQRIADGKIRELGKNEGINTEVLLELNPNVVVGFGVEGVNKTFEIIKKAGIPVIYNGDWVESSALAKAEWIKFFGVLYNKEKEADSILAKLNGYHPVLLDERGKRFASLEFANFIKKSGESFGPKIAFCIGGADGHSDILKRKIRDHVSLSDLTLPHMIVRLILAEQLYRAESIIKGHPYHREG